MARPGRFIALEGLDGAGTTTQAARLVARLRAAGRDAHLTREPSDGPLGVLIRQILKGRLVAAEGAPVDAAAVALLFAADRLEHLQSEIVPRLAAGVDVVSDRYLMSSLAYQGAELDLRWVAEINRRARAPDVTVFLEVTPKVAAARRAARAQDPERFESTALQRKIHRTYAQALAAGEGVGRLVRIDGAAGVDAVAEAVWAGVGKPGRGR